MIDEQWIRNAHFDVIIYPDIGMIMESIWLANRRLAPIQIGCYGHSVSTHGALIDYWFAGADAENVIQDEAAARSTAAASSYAAAAPHHSSSSLLPIPITHHFVNLSTYSEVAILLPGLGITHERPTWRPPISRLTTLIQTQYPQLHQQLALAASSSSPSATPTKTPS